MSSFFKNKNFVKISILLGVSIVLFFCLFLNENLNIKSLEKKTTEASFFKKSLDNYNDFFEIQKITLNGRGKSDLSSIKNIVNSELYKNKNIIKYNTLNITMQESIDLCIIANNTRENKIMVYMAWMESTFSAPTRRRSNQRPSHRKTLRIRGGK